MAQPLRWMIELFDRLSGPADHASQALAKLDEMQKKAGGSSAAMDKQTLKTAQSIAKQALEVPRLQKQLDKLTEELKGSTDASKAYEGWASKLTAVTAVGTAAFNVLRSVGSAAFNTGEAMLDAAAKQDRTNRAFKNLIGEGGPALQAYLKNVAKSTEFTATQLQDLVLPLARQGFGQKDIERLLPAVLDVQARDGDAFQAVKVLSKIASTGKVEGEAFEQLGLKAPATLKVIGQLAGITDVAKVKQGIEQGKIGASQILEGVLLSIARGGKLGDAAVEAATSPAAALNKFRNISDTIFSRLAESGALPKISAALDRFTVAVTSDKFVEGLSMFVDSVATKLAALDWAAVGAGVARIGELAVVLLGGAKQGAGVVGLQTGISEFGGTTITGGIMPGAELGIAARVDKFLGRGAFASANDFLARSDGSILRINSQDDVLGFKPGGPVEQAMSGPRADGGGRMVSIAFGDINVGAGGNADDIKAAIRDVVASVWSDYAVAEGA